MSRVMDELAVTSHVGRDLEQSAALFKTDKKVVWEYVVNGLQYTDEGVVPTVKVNVESKKKRITIVDNGRGMSFDELKNFFTMHGENLDRKKGKGGRGIFGTGKCAAFGIANSLTVTTVQNGLQSKVRLTRSMFSAPASAKQVPVEVLDKEKRVAHPNGTLIEIDDINLRSLDSSGIIKDIERQLQHLHWCKNARIYVNDHECEATEPPFIRQIKHVADGPLHELVGEKVLTLKVSGCPLEPENSGVAILAGGDWLESTLAGAENKEYSQFIFGSIDVPELKEQTTIPAFDQSRATQLNRENDLVRVLLGFVGRHVDALRRELVNEEKARKATEETRKLEGEAAKIAEVLNSDFAEFKSKISSVRAKTSGLLDSSALPSVHPSGDAEILSAGGDIAATRDGSVLREFSGQDRSEKASEETVQGSKHETNDSFIADQNIDSTKAHRETAAPSRRSRAGGFGVAFKEMGELEQRARYMPAERIIYINLDHPQFRAAKGVNWEDSLTFRHLSYEVAFSEYAVALASELANNEQYGDPSDPIVDIRETMNRISRRAASLFKPFIS